ncbi:MAG: hypothetical protein QM722_14275 [Piscinibacter sp.]
MNKTSRRDFKDTQVYDWETEPKDERPSEFAPSTTGYSLHSGFYVAPVVSARRSRRGAGFTVWLLASGVLGGGLLGLFGLVRVLKGS